MVQIVMDHGGSRCFGSRVWHDASAESSQALRIGEWHGDSITISMGEISLSKK
jgi:hypothetical protein